MKLQILVVVVVRRLSKVFIFATSVLVSKLDSFTYLVCGCNVMVMFPKMNPDSIVLLCCYIASVHQKSSNACPILSCPWPECFLSCALNLQ
jgi:hypothetical protein